MDNLLSKFPRDQKRGLIEGRMSKLPDLITCLDFRAIKSAVSLKGQASEAPPKNSSDFRAIKSAVSLKVCPCAGMENPADDFRAIKSAVSLKGRGRGSLGSIPASFPRDQKRGLIEGISCLPPFVKREFQKQTQRCERGLRQKF